MTATPRDFQTGAIAHHVALLRAKNASAEASVPGFGKTFVAAFAAREMGHELVVCCPRVVIPHWQAACAAVGAKVRCISNYEQHKLGNTEMGQWTRQPSRRKDGAGKVIKSFGGTWRWTFPKPTLLVLDEAHYCKNRSSQNAKLCISAKRQGIPTLVMSATLAVDPTDLYATGYLLGLHDGDFGWDAFQSSYGVIPMGFEKKFSPLHDPTALARLNALLFPAHGHRKTYADIPGFPTATDDVRAVEPESVELAEDSHEAWDRVWVLEQLRKEATTAVTERLRARQLAELAKCDAIIALARDLIASGLSVPIFLNFHDSIDYVAKALKTRIIDGRVDDGARQLAIERFQADKDHCLVLQTASGGVGISLHDTHGNRPRHALISPGDNARDFIQVLGRVRRDGQKSPAFRTVITLAGSVESRVHANLTAKVGQIDTINDGDLDPLSGR